MVISESPIPSPMKRMTFRACCGAFWASVPTLTSATSVKTTVEVLCMTRLRAWMVSKGTDAAVSFMFQPCDALARELNRLDGRLHQNIQDGSTYTPIADNHRTRT